MSAYINCESIYTSSSTAKKIKRNTTKNKFIPYLCFIVVDLIHSCHHHIMMSRFSLKKNKFRSIDLTCWRSMKQLRLRFLNSLNTSSWKDFWSKGDSSHFENSASFQISWTWSDVSRINENFIQQLSTMFTCQRWRAYTNQGRFVRKPVNVNQGLKVNRGTNFSSTEMFFTAYSVCFV